VKKLLESVHICQSYSKNITCTFFMAHGVVDQSSPDLFLRTQEKSIWKHWFSDFGYLEPFRRYSRSKSKVV